MADMMDTLKGLLGDNADDKISGIMQILSSDGGNEQVADTQPPSDAAEDNFTISPEMLQMAQGLMSSMHASEDDTRTKLLMSLKPYVKEKRRDTIDNAIKLLNMAQLSQFFKGVF